MLIAPWSLTFVPFLHVPTAVVALMGLTVIYVNVLLVTMESIVQISSMFVQRVLVLMVLLASMVSIVMFVIAHWVIRVLIAVI